MDRVLAQSWCIAILTGLLLLSCSARLTTASGCLDYTSYWIDTPGLDGIATCSIAGSHFWWQGEDICDRDSFHRLSGSTGCRDADATCHISSENYYLTNTTFICCTGNSIDIVDASVVECTQIGVCPKITSVIIPPIVTTEIPEKAYITVTSKPFLEAPPFNLLLFVESNRVSTQVNYTTTLIPPAGAAAVPEGIYVVEFTVPRALVQDLTAKLEFASLFLDRSNFDSSCSTPSLPEYSRFSRIIPNTIEPTIEPTISTRSPEVTTGSGLAASCVTIGIFAGVSIAMLVIGLLVGLIIALTIWCCWCVRKNYTCKNLKSGRFPHGNLPLPPDQTCSRSPPNLPFRQFSHVSTSSGTTPIITPTDQSKLLAGQTPNAQPTFTLHPLHPESISPYATTEDVKKTEEYISGGRAGFPPMSSGNANGRMSTSPRAHPPPIGCPQIRVDPYRMEFEEGNIKLNGIEQGVEV